MRPRRSRIETSVATPSSRPSRRPPPPPRRPPSATVAKTKGAKATSYWLVNVLVVEGDAKTLDKVAKQLAKQPGRHQHPRPAVYPLVKPVETSVAILAAAGDPEWGVEKIRADEAWVDGVLGQGIVVANVDTGVDSPTRPCRAVPRQQRRRHFTHDYNWWDPTGSCGDEPCDNVGHGTHTMGTMVGGDGPGPFTPDTGVAPGRPVDRGQGLRGLRLQRDVAPVVRPVHPRADRPRRRRTPTRPAPRHRQQLLGRRPRRHVLPRDRPGLARRRDHPGLLVRQPRPVLRRGRLARRLPRVVQRRRHRHRRRDRRVLRPRPVRRSARSTRTSPPPASTSSRASRAAATRPSTARPWPPRTSRAPSR